MATLEADIFETAIVDQIDLRIQNVQPPTAEATPYFQARLFGRLATKIVGETPERGQALNYLADVTPLRQAMEVVRGVIGTIKELETDTAQEPDARKQWSITMDLLRFLQNNAENIGEEDVLVARESLIAHGVDLFSNSYDFEKLDRLFGEEELAEFLQFDRDLDIAKPLHKRLQGRMISNTLTAYIIGSRLVADTQAAEAFQSGDKSAPRFSTGMHSMERNGLLATKGAAESIGEALTEVDDPELLQQIQSASSYNQQLREARGAAEARAILSGKEDDKSAVDTFNNLALQWMNVSVANGRCDVALDWYNHRVIDTELEPLFEQMHDKTLVHYSISRTKELIAEAEKLEIEGLDPSENQQALIDLVFWMAEVGPKLHIQENRGLMQEMQMDLVERFMNIHPNIPIKKATEEEPRNGKV